MKTIHYGNSVDTKGNKKTLVVGEGTFKEVEKLTGHYGFGGEDKDSYYVDVNEWNKALEICNEAIKYGFSVFVKKETQFNIK